MQPAREQAAGLAGGVVVRAEGRVADVDEEEGDEEGGEEERGHDQLCVVSVGVRDGVDGSRQMLGVRRTL